MLLDLLLLAAALVALVFGADLLVRGASFLATRLGISPFVIGLTVIAFGTSAPELAAGLAAALRDQADIAVGNVVGSNIMNIGLVLGVAAMIRALPVESRAIRREVWLVILVSLVPFTALATDSVLTRGHGALLVLALFGFIVWSWKRGGVDAIEDELPEIPEKGPLATLPVNLLLIVVGLAMLVGGSMLLVASASSVARELGVSELVIALTIVAFGTSTPELVTTVVAAWRGRADLGVGNILGSNLFNILAILGIVATVKPLAIAPQAMWFDTPVMLGFAVACIPILLRGHRISRLEGVLLFGSFATYTVLLFTVVPGWFAS